MKETSDSMDAPLDGAAKEKPPTGLLERLRAFFGGRNGESSVRETIEEMIEEREGASIPFDEEERILLANILKLRDRTVEDAMVPRADIVAVECGSPLRQVVETMTGEGHSRLPVYRETLDDVVGVVHIKDVLAAKIGDGGDDTPLADIVRRLLFVPPSMRVHELLLEMRASRMHMALVVDEYGGIDGLVTIEDLVEEIVGEIEDEHDRDAEPVLMRRADGAYDADARVTIETFEEVLGPCLTEEEREDIDTLGGLVFALAGRIPSRGELIAHPSGHEFEVLDADPRRIRRLRVRKADPSDEAEQRETS